MSRYYATVEVERVRPIVGLYGTSDVYEAITLEIVADVDLESESVEIVSAKRLEADGWCACGLEDVDRNELDERFLEMASDLERGDAEAAERAVA